MFPLSNVISALHDKLLYMYFIILEMEFNFMLLFFFFLILLDQNGGGYVCNFFCNLTAVVMIIAYGFIIGTVHPLYFQMMLVSCTY